MLESWIVGLFFKKENPELSEQSNNPTFQHSNNNRLFDLSGSTSNLQLPTSNS